MRLLGFLRAPVAAIFRRLTTVPSSPLARSFMRLPHRVEQPSLASTAPPAVEAFSFLAFLLRRADQEHRHGWLRIAIHGDGRQVSPNCVFLALGSFSWRPSLPSVMTGDLSMKKLALAVAAVLTLLSLAGCGTGVGKGKAPPPVVTKG